MLFIYHIVLFTADVSTKSVSIACACCAGTRVAVLKMTALTRAFQRYVPRTQCMSQHMSIHMPTHMSIRMYIRRAPLTFDEELQRAITETLAANCRCLDQVGLARHVPGSVSAYLVMAYVVMVQVVMAYIVMACIVMTYTVMVYIVVPGSVSAIAGSMSIARAHACRHVPKQMSRRPNHFNPRRYRELVECLLNSFGHIYIGP